MQQAGPPRARLLQVKACVDTFGYGSGTKAGTSNKPTSRARGRSWPWVLPELRALCSLSRSSRIPSLRH